MKIAPCVLEGVLFVFFTTNRQMINDKGGGATEQEKGVVGLKYPVTPVARAATGVTVLACRLSLFTDKHT